MGRHPVRSILLAAAAFVLAACQGKTLLEGLDERQANEVIAVLLHDNIDARKRHEGKGGYAVNVDQGDLTSAIDIIHRAELPTPSRRYVAEEFGADGMVSTPQAERVRLLSSIEQRLEESLTQFAGVLSSRVHVSYPTEAGSLRGNAERAMHLSVLLVVEGELDEPALVQSAKRLLRNSFEHVAYDDISVLLTRAGPVRPTTATPRADMLGSKSGWLIAALVAAGVLMLGLAMARRYPAVVPRAQRWWNRHVGRREEGGA